MENKLTVRNLRVSFRTSNGKVQAVRGINFDLIKGETLECEYFLTEDGDQIPYIRLAPVAVTLDNMQSVIIDSGFHLREDVYLNRTDLMKP